MFRLACLVLLLSACVDRDPPHLRTLVTMIATQEGHVADEAAQRLAAEGRPALVVLEAALHTANPAGRRRLVRAIGQVGDEDGCALLGHVARYDEDEQVRREAKDILERWSKDDTKKNRALFSQRALGSKTTD